MLTSDRRSELSSFLYARGASLVGIADLRRLDGIFTSPPTLLAQYRVGIAIAVSLEQYGAYNTTTERRAFSSLRKIASALQAHLESVGCPVRVIPPDRRVAHEGPLYWRGEVSHKAIAHAAGLGWVGKSMLLITPQFGPRLSLVTVLAGIDLATDKPLPNRCGDCTRCIDACTRQALRPAPFEDHPAQVEDALSVQTCGSWIEESWQAGRHCYDCMLACPWGNKENRP